MRKILLALTILIATAGLAAADTIYLRDGRVIHGTLLGFINGRFVVRVEPRNTNYPDAAGNPDITTNRSRDGDIRYFNPNEVEKIEIDGRSLNEGRGEARTVQVTLESNWVDSGVYLRRGDRVQINASGVITVGRTRINPDGLRSTDPSAPLPRAPEGELIGAIGTDSRAPIMELGSSREFTADRTGRLFLTANRGSYTDARGSFNVEIRRDRNAGGYENPNDYERGDEGVRSRSGPGGYGNRSPQEITISVPGTSRGTDTGIDVRAGDPIVITATGTIVVGRRTGEVGPEGGRSSGFGAVVNARPIPSANIGALIAYIRQSNGQLSQAYLIGSNLNTTVPVDGRLILAINDDDFSDNSGSFTVKIRY